MVNLLSLYNLEKNKVFIGIFVMIFKFVFLVIF